jgi:amidase
MQGFAEYEKYDALGLADLVRRRQVTPRELLEAAIERVEQRNSRVNAVVIKLSTTWLGRPSRAGYPRDHSRGCRT